MIFCTARVPDNGDCYECGAPAVRADRCYEHARKEAALLRRQLESEEGLLREKRKRLFALDLPCTDDGQRVWRPDEPQPAGGSRVTRVRIEYEDGSAREVIGAADCEAWTRLVASSAGLMLSRGWAAPEVNWQLFPPSGQGVSVK